MALRSRLKSESGQATMEFALTVILVMAFFLFFFQLALTFAWGNYAHYATFMSARAYLSGSYSQNDQEVRARNVAARMLRSADGGKDRLPFVAKGVAPEGSAADEIPGLVIQPPEEYQPNTRNFSWLQGVRYTFRSRLFLIPFGRSRAGSGSGRGDSVNRVTLTSESWLNREPAYDECVREMDKMTSAIFDNGC